MADKRPVGRDKQTDHRPSPARVVAQSFDIPTRALVTRNVGPAVRYRATLTGEREADGPLFFTRTISAADTNDPNTDQPGPTTTPASFPAARDGDEVIWHVDTKGGAVGVEVWARTDVHTDGTLAGDWIWVLVDSYAAVTSHREYRSAIGQREVYFRIASYVAGSADAVLRATLG